MSVGFAGRRPPEPPPADEKVWRATLRDRQAVAVMRTLPFGYYELRVSVDSELVMTQMRPDAELTGLQAGSGRSPGPVPRQGMASQLNKGRALKLVRWFVRGVGGGLLVLSAFGFLNGLVFRIHGPAFDLGILAGALGTALLFAARWVPDGG